MIRLELPSGMELTENGLIMQMAKMSSEDYDYVFSDKKAKAFSKLIGRLLGETFAKLYSDTRYEATGKRIDFWMLSAGAYQKKFIKTAVNAKRYGIPFENFVEAAIMFAWKKNINFPAPTMVCGPYILSEVISGWEKTQIKKISEDVFVDVGDTSWVWYPGYKWNEHLGMFVKE
jgi:hypothetical protein